MKEDIDFMGRIIDDLENDDYRRVSTALLRIGEISRVLKEDALPKIRRLLKDDEWEIRFSAIYPFQYLEGKQKAAKALVGMISPLQHDRILWAIASALGDIGIADDIVFGALRLIVNYGDDVAGDKAKDVIMELTEKIENDIVGRFSLS